MACERKGPESLLGWSTQKQLTFPQLPLPHCSNWVVCMLPVVQPWDRAASFSLVPERLSGTEHCHSPCYGTGTWVRKKLVLLTATEILGLFPPHSPANLTTLGPPPGAQPKMSPAVPGPSVSLQGWQELGDGVYFARPVPLGFCSVPPSCVKSGVHLRPLLTRETIILSFFVFPYWNEIFIFIKVKWIPD